MTSVYLEFYALENLRHQGRLVHEWLVDLALELDLPGCTVFRAIAGYGHHHYRHDQDFVELQGTLPVEIVFVLDEAQADRLLQRLAAEQLRLFYLRMPVQAGFTTA